MFIRGLKVKFVTLGLFRICFIKFIKALQHLNCRFFNLLIFVSKFKIRPITSKIDCRVIAAPAPLRPGLENESLPTNTMYRCAKWRDQILQTLSQESPLHNF